MFARPLLLSPGLYPVGPHLFGVQCPKLDSVPPLRPGQCRAEGLLMYPTQGTPIYTSQYDTGSFCNAGALLALVQLVTH